MIDNSETNHQAIIEFKGNWYFIYHNGGLPGGGTYRRSVCIDKLEYNKDGTIKKVIRTTTGVPGIPTVDITDNFADKNQLAHSERASKQKVVLTANTDSYGDVLQWKSIFSISGIKLTKKLSSVPGVYIQVDRKTD